VTIDFFGNGMCSGSPAAGSGSIGLDGNGQIDPTGFSFTIDSPGYAFRAHYSGDAAYVRSESACQPLAVVDASIQIAPAEG
jgi:hypothetical protein